MSVNVTGGIGPPSARAPVQRSKGRGVVFIARKLGVAQPTATTHLQALSRAGRVTAKRIGQWTFYRRDEVALAELKQTIAEEL